MASIRSTSSTPEARSRPAGARGPAGRRSGPAAHRPGEDPVEGVAQELADLLGTDVVGAADAWGLGDRGPDVGGERGADGPARCPRYRRSALTGRSRSRPRRPARCHRRSPMSGTARRRPTGRRRPRPGRDGPTRTSRRRIAAARSSSKTKGRSAMTDSIVARSAALRVSGPMCSSDHQPTGMAPVVGTTFQVGLMPYTPQIAAGIRMLPPPSLPTPAVIRPAATPAPVPLEEPPVRCRQRVRVARGGLGGVGAHGGQPELGRVGLAGDDRAGAAEPADDGGVDVAVDDEVTGAAACWCSP